MERMARRADLHSGKAAKIRRRAQATANKKRANLSRKLGKRIGQDWDWGDDTEWEDAADTAADGAPAEGEEVEEECDFESEDCSGYTETLILGLIDGVTGVFAETCTDGLTSLVHQSFMLGRFKNIINPNNTVKAQLAVQNVTDAGNVVFTYCDLNAFYNNFGELLDY